MRARKTEVAAVVGVLEEEHETAEDAAKAVIKTVVELLRSRDSYGIHANTFSGPRAIGPYWDKTQARIAAEKWGGSMEHVRPIVRADFTEITEPAGAPSGNCSECDHPWMAHEFPGRGNEGCVVGQQRAKNGRITKEGCGCKSTQK